MAICKFAAWNIYFSWKLVKTHQGAFRIAPKEKRRAENVARIINELDADVLGIVECMSEAKLKYFRDKFCPQYDGLILNEDKKIYTLGLLFKKNLLSIRKIQIDFDPWKAKIGTDGREATYKFTRPPHVLAVEHKETGNQLALSVVHFKSKRPSNNLTWEQKQKEAIRNRKRIVAESTRLRELLFTRTEANNAAIDRFLVMGDINDGPDFDRYEKQILVSGVESLLGSVLDPGKILYSFVDLSDGKGEPSSSFSKGSVQLDHIVYTQNMIRGSQLPKIKNGSGRVRSDLVNIKRDGKKRDSDHAPVEVRVRF